MKKKTILTALAAAAIAVSAQAQQRVIVPAGQDYTIGNVTAANGDNVTYKWFKNDVEIPNATGASYTVPASSAKQPEAGNTSGSRFQRAAYSADCLGGVALSNEVIVYFCELMVNGVCWAKANSDWSGKISNNAWDWGAFFQWNRASKGYAASDYAGVVNGWNTTPDYAATWTNGVPCPDGWRLPTRLDFQSLRAASNPVGGAWINNQARGLPAGVSGILFGYNTNYCTMSDMTGCIFMPASGRRDSAIGELGEQNNEGRYWTGEQSSVVLGNAMCFHSTGPWADTQIKSQAYSIRCVIDVVQ